MYLGEQWHQAFRVVLPMGPVFALPNVYVIAAFHAAIRHPIRRMVNLITAKNAVNIEIIAAWIFPMTVRWLVRVKISEPFFLELHITYNLTCKIPSHLLMRNFQRLA